MWAHTAVDVLALSTVLFHIQFENTTQNGRSLPGRYWSFAEIVVGVLFSLLIAVGCRAVLDMAGRFADKIEAEQHSAPKEKQRGAVAGGCCRCSCHDE